MREGRVRTGKIAYIAMGTAFTVVCSWLYIPLPVPITLQTFALCLLSALLGTGCGLWIVLCYIALGAAGLPVFSGFMGGVGALMGATGGYITGFLFIPLCVGLGRGRFGKGKLPLALSMGAGILCCYIFGTVWYSHVYSGGSGFLAAAAVCVLPYVIPDGLKVALAVYLSGRLRRHVNPDRPRHY